VIQIKRKNEILDFRMKNSLQLITIVFFASVFTGSCGNPGSVNIASKTSATDTAIISFSEYEQDFGKIAEGEKVSSTFTFQNIGKGPVVISSVTTSCGCTVPKYETKPVTAGGQGTLEVVFDSNGKTGRQTKTITVHSNASKPVILLRITGEVTTNKNN
jgi:hypothetical protein